MKIALVSSIFIPGFGYLEEGLAKVLAGMRHSVTVFASYQYPVNAPDTKRIRLTSEQIVILNRSKLQYRIKRLKTFIKFRSNIFSVGLLRKINELNPELIILVGVSDFFPLPLLKKSVARKYPIYAFIGQNYDMWHWRKNNKKLKKVYSFILNYAIKGFLFRKSIKHLSKIIFYTPDTEAIIKRLVPQKLWLTLNGKMIKIPLGFNSDDFYFNPKSRDSIRKKLKIEADKITLLTVTRVDKSKRITDILDSLHLLRRSDVIYIIIGFNEDSYKAQVEQTIENHGLKDNVYCFPFLESEKLVEYFSAADFGIWLKSGASIQQAMGTGLPVILPMNSTTSELITEGLNGFYIKNNLQDTLSEAFSNYSYDIEKRRRIEAFNRNRFSYQSIFKEILI